MKILYGIFIFIFFIGLSTANTEKTNNIKSLPKLQKQEITIEEVISNKDLIRNQKIQEIIWDWETIFNIAGASKQDPRREKFPLYATWLYDLIKKKQSEYKLPYDNRIYSTLAYIIYKESSVWPDVVGKRGEVGFFQLHGVALQGYSSIEIKNNPRLGMELGINWIGQSIIECNLDIDNWTQDKWIRALSMFSAGPKIKENGQCKKIKVAKHRVIYAEELISRFTIARL